MNLITIYDADQVGPPRLQTDGSLWPTGTPYEVRTDGTVAWTEKTGGPGEEPTTLTINTKARRLTFTVPRLVFFSNRVTVLSALSDHDASGTARTIKKFYIMVETTCERW